MVFSCVLIYICSQQTTKGLSSVLPLCSLPVHQRISLGWISNRSSEPSAIVWPLPLTTHQAFALEWVTALSPPGIQFHNRRQGGHDSEAQQDFEAQLEAVSAVVSAQCWIRWPLMFVGHLNWMDQTTVGSGDLFIVQDGIDLPDSPSFVQKWPDEIALQVCKRPPCLLVGSIQVLQVLGIT